MHRVSENLRVTVGDLVANNCANLFCVAHANLRYELARNLRYKNVASLDALLVLCASDVISGVKRSERRSGLCAHFC